MGFFSIRTNVAALNAQQNLNVVNREMISSLERLSSGLRINSAADDASGMAIADSLRSQQQGLGQAIKNANDGIGIIKIADKAMDEQVKILDAIRTKAIQSAQDGQTTESRKALQSDIVRLMEELDNIASTTSFNGQQLLSGQFSNKQFQIGAYSNQTVTTSIGATSSDKIGSTRFETGATITASSVVSMVFKNVDGLNDIKLESVVISTGAGSGIGVLAETINKSSDKTGVRASFSVMTTSSAAVTKGSISGLSINGVSIGNVTFEANDKTGSLLAAINAVKDTTGVEATIDSRGNLNLASRDGRGIRISANAGLSNILAGQGDNIDENYGRLTLTKLDGRDIVVSTAGIGFSSVAEATVNLRSIKGAITADIASAMGFNPNGFIENVNSKKTAGLTTLKGAQAYMEVAQSAQKQLDRIRSDLGSVQNQLISTVNNISVTQVNIAAAESQIRELDFASESANFSKLNILAQSGSYALSQANAIQQYVLKLLQN